MDAVCHFLRSAYNFWYPAPVVVQNVTMQKINEIIPATLIENRVLNFESQNVAILTYELDQYLSTIKSWHIQRTCDAIIDQQITCAILLPSLPKIALQCKMAWRR